MITLYAMSILQAADTFTQQNHRNDNNINSAHCLATRAICSSC